MKQEDRDLLLKDLCARYPYKVKVNYPLWEKSDFNEPCGYSKSTKDLRVKDMLEFEHPCNYFGNSNDIPLPFLRPISSLTDDEQYNLGRLIGSAAYNLLGCNFDNLRTLLNHCYENHIDIFGLIEKGCAIAVTEEKNPYK